MVFQYKAFNFIFGKVGRRASIRRLCELIKTKYTSLIMAPSVVPRTHTANHSLQFTINKIFFKLFGCLKILTWKFRSFLV